MKTVNAVVVTYNRKHLLEECINALLNQTYKINRIFVINNNSTDGTLELIRDKFDLPSINVISLSKNMGGAGGFYYGTKKAISDADWIWEMDDDTIPRERALEELISASECIEGNIGFLASTVYGINGEPMNVPHIDERPGSNGYCTMFANLKGGIVEIESATLVSLLFNVDAVKKIGAPHPYFFIWGDDTEYTLRMTHCYGKAYLVGKSEVIHKRLGGNNISIINEENKARIRMYKMMYRNNLVCSKSYSSRKKYIISIVLCLVESFKVLVKAKNKRFLRFFTVQAGFFEFLFGMYNKAAYDNRFNNINENYLDNICDTSI